MNKLERNNIDKGEEQGKGDNEGQNHGENNNNHAEISEDEGLYVDPDDNDYDLNDIYQHGYYSTSNSGNEHNVDKSDNDNDRDPNDIGQNKEAATICRINHNMST